MRELQSNFLGGYLFCQNRQCFTTPKSQFSGPQSDGEEVILMGHQSFCGHHGGYCTRTEIVMDESLVGHLTSWSCGPRLLQPEYHILELLYHGSWFMPRGVAYGRTVARIGTASPTASVRDKSSVVPF